MRVCVIAEGCYPYVVGGVSSWIHSLIQQFPNIEFVLTTIVSGRSERGKFVYNFPQNITEVYEIYINDCLWKNSGKLKKHKRLRLNSADFEAVRSLVIGDNVNWKRVFDVFQNRITNINDFLMGEDFLKIAEEVYELVCPNIVFSDYLWTMRSIYLPLGFILQHKPVKADIYHCVSTGYAGIVGSMAKEIHGGALLISEHGIYTREREEEIIKARWVKDIYKDFWIDQFKKMSVCAYNYADIVTALFSDARLIQIELGCPSQKTRVTPNGISIEQFEDIEMKKENDDMINIGAVLRVTPVKDVKTMINAFYYAKKKNDKLKLWIMGSWDEDEEYAQECFKLVQSLKIKDIVFTGRIQVKDYIGKMDFLILTSISEGQPMTILEGFAAGKPTIATNVGNCKGLVYGEVDDYGAAGIIVPVMNIEKISSAILELANDKEKCVQMGKAGYKRACLRYRVEDMKKVYLSIYRELSDSYNLEWTDNIFSIDIGSKGI